MPEYRRIHVPYKHCDPDGNLLWEGWIGGNYDAEVFSSAESPYQPARVEWTRGVRFDQKNREYVRLTPEEFSELDETQLAERFNDWRHEEEDMNE